jgi:membrane protease YdiL (CAAX protease family)
MSTNSSTPSPTPPVVLVNNTGDGSGTNEPALQGSSVAGRVTVWPVFVAYVVASGLGVMGSVLVSVVVAIVLSVSGVSAVEAGERLGRDPLLLILVMAPFQIVLLGSAFVAARWMGPSVAVALGLSRPRLGPGAWAAILIGTGIPLALAVGLSSVMPSFQLSASIPDMWRTISLPLAVLWVLFIGFAPGVCEELFFRGLVQRRLAAAWSPVAAIGVTSVLFAIMHIDPPAAMLALVLGIWFGFVAWRMGSTWPTMTAHASVNALWNIGQIVTRQADVASSTLTIVLGVLGVVSLVCFVAAMRMLMRRQHAREPTHSSCTLA